MSTPAACLPVLVVEDDADVALALTLVLARCGHDARRARDADEALAAVRDWPPRVVILDVGLPGRDGYEVARRLCAVVFPRPRLVALTGNGAASCRERSRREAFDGHLLKPVDAGELEGLLRGFAGAPP